MEAPVTRQGAERLEIEIALRRSPLLFDLPPETLDWFAATADLRRLPAGTIVFRMGELGRELFVIARGEIEIVVPAKPGREEVLSRLGPGTWFGEMAVLTGEGRSATARVSADAILIAIDRGQLERLVGFAPIIAMRLSDGLSRRLRESTLRRCFPSSPQVVLIEDDEASGSDGIVAGCLARELGDELGRDVVLFAPDVTALDEPGVLRRGQAASAAEVVAATSGGRLAVVLLSTPGPMGEAIRALPAARVTHVEVAAAARASIDPPPSALMTSPLRRLARRLLARRVALVLGAGAAKGFCHIGAIRAFERAGIRFDLIVGTSIGALIGGFAARPSSGDELHLGFREIARDFRRLVVDLRLFGPSLLRGRKKTSMLAAYALGRNLEDLPIPFHAVTADLRSARETVLSRGPLAQAIDAATAVPTVFPPIAIGAQRLVDGWMVNPLPADVALAEGAFRIVAINPSAAEYGAGARIEHGARSRSIVARLARSFDLGARLRVAIRAMDVSARDRAEAAKPLIDFCLEPPLARFAGTDVRHYERIVEVGERAADAAMATIRDVLRHNAGHYESDTGGQS